MQTFISSVSEKEFPTSDKVLGKHIHPAIFKLIKADNTNFDENSLIAVSELNYFRQKYISNYLINEIGEVTELEETVLQSLNDIKSITKIAEDNTINNFTFGQKIADKVASFGGSWTFIISFAIVIFVWIVFNILFLRNKGFDPYPFILLNLVLSCLAALQAPVIMMSQNRQEEKDRDRAKKDYMINLKSELEIRMLHEKIDHLIMHQQQELLEIQKVQIEMMNNIIEQIDKKNL